jgi:hypothetical protein
MPTLALDCTMPRLPMENWTENSGIILQRLRRYGAALLPMTERDRPIL